jgi:hypothetical protein
VAVNDPEGIGADRWGAGESGDVTARDAHMKTPLAVGEGFVRCRATGEVLVELRGLEPLTF